MSTTTDPALTPGHQYASDREWADRLPAAEPRYGDDRDHVLEPPVLLGNLYLKMKYLNAAGALDPMLADMVDETRRTLAAFNPGLWTW